MRSGNTAPFGMPGRQFPAAVVIALLNGEGVKSGAPSELRRSVDELMRFLCRSGSVSREAACTEAIRQFPALARIYREDPTAEMIGWTAALSRVRAVIAIQLNHMIDPVTRVIWLQVPTASSVEPTEPKK